jgi:hypothetical protein
VRADVSQPEAVPPTMSAPMSSSIFQSIRRPDYQPRRQEAKEEQRKLDAPYDVQSHAMLELPFIGRADVVSDGSGKGARDAGARV